MEWWPSGQKFHSKDDPRKKSASPMKSVVTLLLRSRLKWDSYAYDSEKKKNC